MPDPLSLNRVDHAMNRPAMRHDLKAHGLFERFANTTPDILYIYDVRKRRHVYVNRRIADVLGYRPDEIVEQGGALMARLAHPDDLPLLDAHFARLEELGDDEIAAVDHRMLAADGVYRWLSCRGTVFSCDRHGRVARVVGVVRDITRERQMIDALRESETRFRAIADDAPVLIWMTGPDGGATDFSKPWLDFTGRTLAQERGDGWMEGVHPDDLQRCLETYRSHFNRRDPLRMEYRLRGADGNYHWIDNSGIPRFAADGEFLGYIGSCVDVTERRRMEQAHRESEERFRVMADTVPDILFVSDADRNCLYVNARFAEYTGMPPGAAHGRGWFAAVHPDDLARVRKAFGGTSGDISRYEVRLKAADGSYRWFVVRTRALRDEGGHVVRRFGAATDIDELKRAHEAVQCTNARLGAIIDSISDCYYTLDREWRFSGMNAHAARWLGVSQAGIIGRHYESIPLPKRLRPYIERAMDAGTPVRVEITSAARPGRWAGVHIYPSPEGVSVFFRDVSERKFAEEEARARQELLQSTIDALSAQVAVLDRDGAIVAVNAAWRRFAATSGCTVPDFGLGARYVEVRDRIRPGCGKGPEVASGLQAMLRGEHETFRIDYPCHCSSEVRWFDLRVTRFGSGDEMRLVLAHEDVTDMKRAEGELRRLTGRLLVLQDDERRRIARELHDSTAQNLVGLAFNLDRLERRRSMDEAAAAAIIADSRGLIDRSLKELRTLSYLLHSPLLDDAGLVPALRSYIAGFSRRSGIKVDTALPPSMSRLPRDVESALFRVVQEALANVHRHSGSATASVRLSRNANRVTLEIVDNGTGIADHADSPGQDCMLPFGVGIPGMQARLRQFDGDLEVHSRDGGGTTIRAVVPVA